MKVVEPINKLAELKVRKSGPVPCFFPTCISISGLLSPFG